MKFKEFKNKYLVKNKGTQNKLAEHFYKFFVLSPEIKYKIEKLKKEKNITWALGNPPDP